MGDTRDRESPPLIVPHPNQRRLACERCRRHKLKCSKQNEPDQLRCHRCTRLDFDCVEGRQGKIGRPTRSAVAAAAAAAAAVATSSSAPTETSTATNMPNKALSRKSCSRAQRREPSGTPEQKVINICTPEPYDFASTTRSSNIPDGQTTSRRTGSFPAVPAAGLRANDRPTALGSLLPIINSGLGGFATHHEHYPSSSTTAILTHDGDATGETHHTVMPGNQQPAVNDLRTNPEVFDLTESIAIDPALWTSNPSMIQGVQPAQAAQQQNQAQPLARFQQQQQQQQQQQKQQPAMDINGYQQFYQQPLLQQQQQQQDNQSKTLQSQFQMPGITRHPSHPHAFFFPFPISAYPLFDQGNSNFYPLNNIPIDGAPPVSATSRAIIAVNQDYTDVVVKLLRANTSLHEYHALIQKYQDRMSIDLLVGNYSPLTSASQTMIRKGVIAIQDFFNALIKLQETLSLKSLDSLISLTIISCYTQSLKFLELITFHINHTLDNIDTRPLYTIPNTRGSTSTLSNALFQGTLFAQGIINLIRRLDEVVGVPYKDPSVEPVTSPSGLLSDAQLKMLLMELGEQHANGTSRPQKLLKDLTYMKEVMSQQLVAHST